MAIGYDKDKNYREEIDKAAALGHYRLAAELEVARNAKITGEDMEYQKTYDYAKWLGNGKPYASGRYEEAPSYSGYQSQINALAGQLDQQKAFSYDASRDPLYDRYKEVYTREGTRAMQDTIGQVSARTGGLASSYAATAGAQANNVYMAKLADKIPELQKLAYDMYAEDRAGKRADINTLLALERSELERYEALLEQYNKNRASSDKTGRST